MLKKNHLKIYVWMQLFLIMITAAGLSQQTHFIYFQHEQSAPFYIKYKDQILRSSSQGYLILSRLNKGMHAINIGLSDSGQHTLIFMIDSLKSDKGYLIKDFGASGWGLFDLQTSVVLYGKNDDLAGSATRNKYRADSLLGDGFGDMLAKVTKDSTVKYVSVINTESRADSIKGLSVGNKTDSLEFKKIASKSKEPSIEGSKITNNTLQSVSVIRLLSKNETTGLRSFMFVIASDISTDTVQVLIENISALELNKIDSTKPVVDVIIPTVSDSVIIIRDTERKDYKQTVLKNECRAVADEYGFVKLRKKMAGQLSEEKMLEEAKKTFKQTCFSASQIGQLSLLLVTDEMKYRFFDAALKYTSDLENFPALGKQIQDEYYRKRFDALIPNP
jgi:hypothetical protein